MPKSDTIALPPEQEAPPPTITETVAALVQELTVDVSHLNPADRCRILESRLGDITEVLASLSALIVGQAELIDESLGQVISVVNAQGRVLSVLAGKGSDETKSRIISLNEA